MTTGRITINQRTRHISSESPEETRRIGLKIGRSLPVPGVVLLRGALGTGKTTLTRGIAQGLGLEDPGLVNSPSFTLVNIYHGICPIYHVDLYRLEGERDLYSIGMDDFLGSDGVTVIEWSERLSAKIDSAIEIEIEDAGDDLRILHICIPAKRPGKQSKPLKTPVRSRFRLRRRLK
ncbi:MAG TPA: tRNA (adenosine(37)-N6)-threonylcarbamoyltransferase complex ATPase subunit type 1 TsaE [Acidobacteriota bacterium]|nr:tRNA (adenosine(37)-N6)-threonylcarbamoyltransferase complex ATPase subunit type 1 TsaE [Acidobacteriota bacterium]